MAKGYQVWHDIGWPESRLRQVLDGGPPTPFPEGYVHVATVQANGLREAVALTTGQGSIREGNAIPWERNPGVAPRPGVLAQRDTDQGDVIVDPSGNAYRVTPTGFSALPVAKENHPALAALFNEWRADYAAARREDAHWYGNAPPQDLLPDQTPPQPAPGGDKDRSRALNVLPQGGEGMKEPAVGETPPLTIAQAPAATPPAAEPHRRDQLVLHQTRASIMTRLEAFGDAFERLARTAEQGVQAERFKAAVHDFFERGPLTAADLSPAGTDFPGWLQEQAGRFAELATTPAQKELAASFREFAREVGSPAVHQAFQKPLVNELVEDIKAWMGGSVNGVPFAQLSPEGKRELLDMGVDWTDYINRGLAIETNETWMGIDAVIDNALAGKPPERWMEGTKPLAIQDLVDRARPSDPTAKAPQQEPDRGIER